MEHPSKIFKTRNTQFSWVPKYDCDMSDVDWKIAVAKNHEGGIKKKSPWGNREVTYPYPKGESPIYKQIESMRSTMPTENVISHNGFATYLFSAWRDEAGVVLRPDIIAGTVLKQVATYINKNPDNYRDLYSANEEKITMEVVSPADEISIETLTKMVKNNMKCEELADTFLTEFDCQPPEYAKYTKMCLLQSGISYYNYDSTRCCIPAVMLVGGLSDWTKLLNMLLELKRIFKIATLNRWGEETYDRIYAFAHHAAYVITTLINLSFDQNLKYPTIEKLHNDYTNDKKYTSVDSFYDKMFYIEENRCGSGHPYYCRGWFNIFYLEDAGTLDQFEGGITYVPYMDTQTKRMWYYAMGLAYSIPVEKSGITFYEPYYAEVKHEVLDEELFNKIAMREKK